jgi:hypothetical protein
MVRTLFLLLLLLLLTWLRSSPATAAFFKLLVLLVILPAGPFPPEVVDCFLVAVDSTPFETPPLWDEPLWILVMLWML